MTDLATVRIPVFLPGNTRDWRKVEGMATITEEGDVVVKLIDPADAKRLVDMAKEHILWQVAFDYRMDAATIEKINTQHQKEEPERLTHNDETLGKVYDALKGLNIPDQTIIDAVMRMQNAGILFREIAK